MVILTYPSFVTVIFNYSCFLAFTYSCLRVCVCLFDILMVHVCAIMLAYVCNNYSLGWHVCVCVLLCVCLGVCVLLCVCMLSCVCVCVCVCVCLISCWFVCVIMLACVCFNLIVHYFDMCFIMCVRVCVHACVCVCYYVGVLFY